MLYRLKLLFVKDRELYAFCYSILGFFPHNIDLYRLAFVHRSLPIKAADGQWANNERLEFLGDAILDAAVADILYTEFASEREGFLTSTRAKIVQRESLNRIGLVLGLDKMVKASTRTMSHNSYIYGNAVEALVGAVYLDRGYRRCKKFIAQRIIQNNFDLKDVAHTEINFKSRLIEWTQKYRVSIDFELVETMNDADNNPLFKTAILLGGNFAADAVGYSKKESHQIAAKAALERLNRDFIFKDKVLETANENLD